MMAVPPIVAVAMALTLALLVPTQGTLSVVMFAIAAMFTILAVLMLWLSPRLAQRRAPEVFQQEIVVTLDRDGVHGRRSSISTDVGWDDVSRVSVDGRFVTLWSGRSAIAIVPVRAFATSADRDDFIAVARSHLRNPDVGAL